MKNLWDVILVQAFTVSECATILSMMEDVPLEDALVRGGELDHRERDSRLRFVTYDSSSWVFKRLWSIVEHVNHQTFQFSVSPAFEEGLQYTEYNVNGHYGWHTDLGSARSSMRKLSLVVQLDAHYEGGVLEFMPAQFIIPKQVGLLALFPSYIPHRVTPVTSGVRHTLVSWVHGYSTFL